MVSVLSMRQEVTDSINSARCGLWFQRIEEVVERTPVTPSIKNKPSPAVCGLRGKRRRSVDSDMQDEDEDVRLYKRVRLVQKRYRHKSKPPGNVYGGEEGIESANLRSGNALVFEPFNTNCERSFRYLPPWPPGSYTFHSSSGNDRSKYDREWPSREDSRA
jgi:hypothetical protein